MSKNITAWERAKMCNETKYHYISKMPLQCSWNLLDLTVSAALSLVVESDRHNFIHFQKSPVSLPDTSLPPPSLKGHRQKAVSYQNSSSLKPVKSSCSKITITPQSASTAILRFCSQQVYSWALSPKRRGTQAQQLTEIKSDISTICLKNVRPLTH